MIFWLIMLYCLNLWYNRYCGSVICYKIFLILWWWKIIYRLILYDINIVMGWNGGDVFF